MNLGRQSSQQFPIGSDPVQAFRIHKYSASANICNIYWHDAEGPTIEKDFLYPSLRFVPSFILSVFSFLSVRLLLTLALALSLFRPIRIIYDAIDYNPE